MNGTNGGILGGVLLLLLLFSVYFFINIRKGRKKRALEKKNSPTAPEIAVIRPVPVTNLVHFDDSSSVWDDDAEYWTTDVVEEQNTQPEKEKLNLSLTQEEIIKEQSKIFHETYTKVLAKQEREREVQSVIDVQKKIYTDIKQHKVLAERQQSMYVPQSVIDDQKKIFETLKKNAAEAEMYVPQTEKDEQKKIFETLKKNAAEAKMLQSMYVPQTMIENQKKIFEAVKRNAVDVHTSIEDERPIYSNTAVNTLRRQFEARPFNYGSSSGPTPSSSTSVNMFPQTTNMLQLNDPHRKEYYQQPSFNPNYY